MSIKVVREKSDQRRHHRVTAPLFVSLDGHRCRAADWSLGGLRVESYPGQLPEVGAPLTLTLTLPFQGFDVGFECKAEVVRRDPARAMFAVKFTEIGEREQGLMEHFIEELIRGSMSSAEDTIQRIDVPVTPASTKPDASPLEQVPIARWPTRTIAYTTLYLVIGFFVFGYALILGYTNFVRMEVDTAVITAPVENVRAQVEGRISYGRFRAGDPVPAGALIMHVLDHELEKEIDLTTLEIRDRKAQLVAYNHQLVEELARVQAFANVERKNIDQVRLELESTEAQARAAAAQHARLKHLFAQGFTTSTQLEASEKQAIAAQKLADAKRIELGTRSALASDNAGERLYTGQTFFGDRAKVEAQVLLARQQVEIAEQKLQALLNHKSRLSVYAPFDGVLQELPRVSGSLVRKGDTIAIIENPHAREITAYMRQDEVLSVGLGDEVQIYLPGLSELRKATVKSIDRTAGFVSEMNATYIWRAPRDRSARVVLSFTDRGANPSLESYRPGMPAIAIFSTRPTNYLIGDMMKRFQMVFGGRPRKQPQPAASVTSRGGTAGGADPDVVAAEVGASGEAARGAATAGGQREGFMPPTDLPGRDYRLVAPTVAGARQGASSDGQSSAAILPVVPPGRLAMPTPQPLPTPEPRQGTKPVAQWPEAASAPAPSTEPATSQSMADAASGAEGPPAGGRSSDAEAGESFKTRARLLLSSARTALTPSRARKQDQADEGVRPAQETASPAAPAEPRPESRPPAIAAPRISALPDRSPATSAGSGGSVASKPAVQQMQVSDPEAMRPQRGLLDRMRERLARVLAPPAPARETADEKSEPAQVAAPAAQTARPAAAPRPAAQPIAPPSPPAAAPIDDEEDLTEEDKRILDLARRCLRNCQTGGVAPAPIPYHRSAPIAAPVEPYAASAPVRAGRPPLRPVQRRARAEGHGATSRAH